MRDGWNADGVDAAARVLTMDGDVGQTDQDDR
jgi:hypothetical protein